MVATPALDCPDTDPGPRPVCSHQSGLPVRKKKKLFQNAPALRYALQEAGITQRALARALGVDAKTVGRWISGDHCMPLWAITHTAQLCHIEREYLLHPDFDPNLDPYLRLTTNLSGGEAAVMDNLPDLLDRLINLSEQLVNFLNSMVAAAECYRAQQDPGTAEPDSQQVVTR